MKFQNIQVFFFLSLFVGVSLVLALIFWPYALPILAGILLAIVMRPVYLRIKHGWFHHSAVSAFLTVIIVFCFLFVPIILFALLLTSEATDIYLNLAAGGGLSPLLMSLIDRVNLLIPDLNLQVSNITGIISSASQYILNSAGNFFATLANVLLALFLTLIVLFYCLKDGDSIKSLMVKISPLSDFYDSLLFDRLKQSVNAVVRGTLMVCVLQGLAASIGYAIFGAPAPIVWGLVTMVAALIPATGTLIIWFPLTIYLFFTGNPISAIGLFAWSALITSTVDNFVTPNLIEKDLQIHPLLILLSILGGIQLFGLLGALLGPIVLSVWLALVSIYQKEFANYFFQAEVKDQKPDQV